MDQSQPHIRWFGEIGIGDVALVGGKSASLGEMYQNLTAQGVRVPNGFAVTAEAYRYVLEQNDAWQHLHRSLDGVDPDNIKDLQIRGEQARKIVYNCDLPDDLERAILRGYEQLRQEYGNDISLAVRSSATAEDSPEASFAGQNESYLNISSQESLLDAYKRCLASNFTDRSIHYKYDNGFDLYEVHLAVVVMKMVRSDMASGGVMFSLDTETGFKDVVFINAAFGLGENIVQGTIEPDSFYVHKPSYIAGFRSVLKRTLGRKQKKMVFSEALSTENLAVEFTKNVDTSSSEREKFCISDEDVLLLADYAIKIEDHYSQGGARNKPMDMEWAKDGIDGQLYIVQARPETVSSKRNAAVMEMYHLNERTAVLLQGRAVGARIGTGRVRVVDDISGLSEFQAGDVLVADTTSPDWEPVMKIAAAIVTNRGGRTCHAAIISRELGIPAIVGTDSATDVLEHGQEITVSCAEGETGNVYQGILDFEVQKIDLSRMPRPKTQIMMNLGNPDQAFSLSALPADGIGLARMEFIINEYIKVHPMAIAHPEKLDDVTRDRIFALTTAWDSPTDFLVKTLSEGVATIAASVYPKPCVVRMSDFKTNEYATLLGGSQFEQDEDNPMIGFRGASRYTHPAYAEGFALECLAMKRVRNEMGLTNVKLMIPFCRRVEEAKKVLEAMADQGLARGENDLEIYLMCEIPNNVIQIDAFAELFDGFSIGSNDLTQLTLGVDRDSQIVAFDFDERDPGVMEMIRLAVEGARRNGCHSGICGQAPSDYPEMAEYLIRLGIESISLTPDTVLGTIQLALEVEQRLEQPIRIDANR